MKVYLLAAVMLLLSCKKDDVSPADQIQGSWYYIGYEENDVFTPASKQKAWNFKDDGTYIYYISSLPSNGTYRVVDDQLYRNETTSYVLLRFTDGQMKMGSTYGNNPASWNVYER